MFIHELQKSVKSDIIGNTEKADISNVFWSKFRDEAKTLYKDTAKIFNKCYSLTGRRKITGFWWFAGELLQSLRAEHISDKYVQELFEYLNEEYKVMFVEMNNMNAMKRRFMIYEMLSDETAFHL